MQVTLLCGFHKAKEMRRSYSWWLGAVEVYKITPGQTEQTGKFNTLPEQVEDYHSSNFLKQSTSCSLFLSWPWCFYTAALLRIKVILQGGEVA